MNDILQSIQRLIERPKFFTSLDFTRGRIFRFYLFLILIFTAASVVITLPDAVRFVSVITSQEWRDQTMIVTRLYPDDLEIRMVDGTVSTNAEEPLAIPLPESWRTQQERPAMPENLLVIDTTKSIALEDFAEKNTSFILGKNTLGAWDQQKGKADIYDLGGKSSEGSFVLTKEKYTMFVSRVSSVLQKVFLVGIFLLPVFFYVAYWIGYLVYLIFGAAIVWLVAKQRGYALSYKNAYKAGIYLLPVPLVYDFFVMVLSDFPHVRVPFLFTVFLAVMTLRNFPKASLSPDRVSSSVAVEEDIASQPTDGKSATDLSSGIGTETDKADKPST